MTVVLGCDHLSVYKMASCCDLDFLVAVVLVGFQPSQVSIVCRDLMVM